MRQRIYKIVEKACNKDILSKIYDIFMIVFIFLSLVPLIYKQQNNVLLTLDYVCTSIFILDYILRWITADMRLNIRFPFLKYPFTPFAIIDLLSILPTFNIIGQAFKMLRLLRAFKVIRIFKVLRYSNNFIVISKVIKKDAPLLLSLLVCSIAYIFISALLIFSIEPESFNNFFDAIYWATTALTTVGYGDIYPITTGGRIISMVSSIFGIAMVALPSGVITAGFLSEMNHAKKKRKVIQNSCARLQLSLRQ